MNNGNIEFDSHNEENNREYIDDSGIVGTGVEVADDVAVEYTPEIVNLFDGGEPQVDLAKAKKNFSRIGFGFLIFSGIATLVSLIIQVAVMLVSKEFYSSHLFLNMITPVSMYLFALPVLIAFFRGVKPEPPTKRKIGFGEWMLYLIVGFGWMYIGAMVGNNVMSVLSSLVGYDYMNGLESVVGGGSLWVTAIFAVIIAPIGEEIVFRKLLIDRTGKYGCFVSALLSGVVFGLVHANFYQLFYAAALGFLLGYIYYNTGKIIYTIAIHAVINFFGSIVSSFVAGGLESVDISALEGVALVEAFLGNAFQMIIVAIYSLFVYAAMPAAIVLPIVLRKKLRFDRGEIEIPSKKRMSTVFLNAGMICVIAFYAVEILISILPA